MQPYIYPRVHKIDKHLRAGVLHACTRMLKVLELLREAYQPIFSRIIFTGGTRPTGFPLEERWVECDGSGGSMMQSCLANVMQVQTLPFHMRVHVNKWLVAPTPTLSPAPTLTTLLGFSRVIKSIISLRNA